MATVYSNEVSVGSYNRIRIKCDYSGTSATLTVQFRRTAAYTGTWADSTATLKFNNQSKSASYSYSGNVGTSWVDLRGSISGYTISTSGGTYNWVFNNPSSSSVLGCSGTITIPSQASAPSGLSYSVQSVAWNSVTGKASVSSFGGTGSSLQFIINKTAGSFGDRFAYEVATTATSGTKTCTTSNAVFKSPSNLDTTWPVKGCMTFYPGGWASNTAGLTAGAISSTAQYTPPSPLTSLTKTSSSASTTANEITHTISMTGGTSGSGTTGNNYAVNVDHQYRYSTNGGSSYSDWTSAGTGLTSATKSFTFKSVYGASCKVQARQVYQSKASETKELTFTAQASASPSTPTVSLDSYGKDWVKVKVSISSYGTPSSMSNRYIEGAVLGQNSYGGTYRWATAQASTSNVFTISNSSTTSSTPLTIAPNTKYWYGGYATNRVANAVSKVQGEVVTLPPDITTLTAGEPVLSGNKFTVILSYTNGTGGSAYTESLKYKINGGAEQSTSKTGTLTLNNLEPETTYTVVTYLSTTAGNGASKTVTFTTPVLHKLYGSVNGQTKRVEKLYGSVNGVTKEITKMYGSVNGVTKRIW